MVVSERAASADARGAAGARVTWAMRLSRPGAHAACIVARVLTVGRFVPVGGSLRGDGIQQNSTAVLGNPRRPERERLAICERKMKVLCNCSFLCFVCHRLRERLACMHRMRQLRTCMLRKSGADETPRFGSQAALQELLQGDGPERWRNRLSRLRSHTSTWLYE
jgi:hypothetical protein